MLNNMRAERARRSMRLKDVAKKIGVSENAVQRWESGKSNPTSTNLIALSKLYSVSPDYLIGNKTHNCVTREEK